MAYVVSTPLGWSIIKKKEKLTSISNLERVHVGFLRKVETVNLRGFSSGRIKNLSLTTAEQAVLTKKMKGRGGNRKAGGGHDVGWELKENLDVIGEVLDPVGGGKEGGKIQQARCRGHRLCGFKATSF